MKRIKAIGLFLLISIAFSNRVSAKTITTNELIMENAPSWLTTRKVQKVVDHVQSYLEWDIRKIHVSWYTDEQAFEKIHGFGPSVIAFSRKEDNSVHIGPRVTNADFDSTFGHELTHIITYQKYKDAIPKWLDEGLANFVGKRGKVNYAWLAKQPELASDVRSLVHPFKEVQSPVYHYMASTALVELIGSKCDLQDLLQLSVKNGLENYLSTFCGIDDINDEFRKWVKRKAQ